MPATASIRFNGVATPNEGYAIGSTVNLSNNDDTGVSTWLWTLISKPTGSAAAIASPNIAAPSFVVDVEGTYLVRLVVNDTLPDEDQDTGVARILHQHTQSGSPAKDETGEGDPTEGWARRHRQNNVSVDQRLGLSDKRTVKYVGANTTGPKLLTATGTVVLPNGDTVPTVDILSAGASGSSIFLWDGGALSTNDVKTVLARGLSASVLNPDSLVAGDAVYLGTTGAITKTVPAADRAYLVGYCVAVSGPNVILWFDPTVRFNNSTLPSSVVIDGAALPGTSPQAAHADSAQSLTTFSGTPATVDMSAGAAGTAGSVARGNHSHQVSTGLPIAVTPDASPATGTGPELAAKDHQHGLATYAVNPADVGGSPAAGTAGAAPSRGDHVHAHGNQAAGNLMHAAATTSINGFMSAADKEKLDLMSGLRNALINGGLRYWERSQAATNYVVPSDVLGYNFHAYKPDRWYLQTREDFGAAQVIDVELTRATSGLDGTEFCARIRNNKPGASNQFYQLVQEIDRDVVRSLRTFKVSWSVKVRRGSSSPATTDFFLEAYANTGLATERLAAYTGSVALGSSTVSGASLTTSFQTVTGTSTIVVPAGANGMSLLVGSYQNGAGSGDANDYIEVAEIQLVIGTASPTQFDWASGSVAEELPLCQHYYEKSYPVDVIPDSAGNLGSELSFVQALSTAFLTPWYLGAHPRFKVTKRVTPTIRVFGLGAGSLGNWEVPVGVGFASAGGNISQQSFEVFNNTGLTTPTAGYSAGHWDADAEI